MQIHTGLCLEQDGPQRTSLPPWVDLHCFPRFHGGKTSAREDRDISVYLSIYIFINVSVYINIYIYISISYKF